MIFLQRNGFFAFFQRLTSLFLIDQMAQYFDSFFQAAWKEKKIKKDFGAK
jgi:hypothetical protein